MKLLHPDKHVAKTKTKWPAIPQTTYMGTEFPFKGNFVQQNNITNAANGSNQTWLIPCL